MMPHAAFSRLTGAARGLFKVAISLSAALLLMAPALAGDVAGSSDHPLVGRYEGSEIKVYESSAFDRVSLVDGALPKSFATEGIPADKTLTLEGKSFHIVYAGPEGRSALEVDANFKESLASKGFETIFECFNSDCISGSTSYYVYGGLLDDNGRNARYGNQIAYRLEKRSDASGDIYVSILTGLGSTPYSSVRVLETKPMENDKIVFLDASAMQAGLNVAGHVALYGIYFDTDKADLKPESAPTLVEIARLLDANASLNLIVAGHTDNQGGFDYNIGLSERRAAAVVSALVHEHGVSPSRLVPFGAGMAAPVALNDSDAGRALNRRVELVQR